jgi:hypothetical protein
MLFRRSQPSCSVVAALADSQSSTLDSNGNNCSTTSEDGSQTQLTTVPVAVPAPFVGCYPVTNTSNLSAFNSGNGTSSIINNSNSRGNGDDSGGVRCVDLELPPMVTSDDFWEAAYRMERRAREKLQLELQVQRRVQVDDDVVGDAAVSTIKQQEVSESK